MYKRALEQAKDRHNAAVIGKEMVVSHGHCLCNRRLDAGKQQNGKPKNVQPNFFHVVSVKATKTWYNTLMSHTDPVNHHLATAPRDPMLGNRSRMVLADGTSLSVQASRSHYCDPRADEGPWDAVEVGFPSRVIEELLPFADQMSEALPTDMVYGWVPVKVLNAIIAACGGIVGTVEL